MHDANMNRMVKVPDETEEVSNYFDALETDGFVLANDASTHPSTRGFFANRLALNRITSLIASSVSVNGCLYGALTCTQIETPRTWTQRELSYLRQIGGPASLALHKASRFTPDTGLGPLA